MGEPQFMVRNRRASYASRSDCAGLRLNSIGSAAVRTEISRASGEDTSESQPIYTIGHSTRSIVQFVELLRIGCVQLVVDIRSVPRSRTNPQYNLDALPDALSEYQIGHTRIAELGGLRGKSKSIPSQTNAFWTNQSFHNYADYALTEEFRHGLARLRELSNEHRCAIMCSEAVWWRCHRRIVADYLLYEGRIVCHLMGSKRVEAAKLTSAAKVAGDSLVYPANAR
jgi:uncharacterized protein (DUF488 family)